MLTELLSRIGDMDTSGCAIGLLRAEMDPEFFFDGRCTDDGAPISVGTLWEAASLSKPVVALLALERATRDPELLTQPLTTDVSTFGAADDDRWRELTVSHLLTHTSGLSNWRPAGEALEFESDPGTPGYSGEGFELLLAELSTRSTHRAEALLEQHLQRLEMADSTFTPGLRPRSEMAIGHTTTRERVPKQAPTTPMASGTLHATAADYMRFLQAVARPDRVLDPELRRAAQHMAERSVEFLPGHGRTLGWAFIETDSGDVLWQHGDNPGFKHVAAVRPATGEAVLVLTNGDDGQPLYRDVCRQFLNVEVW